MALARRSWRACASIGCRVWVMTRGMWGWGAVISLKAAVAEAERKKASYRTRRGLRGNAEKGLSTGGKAYGYKSAVDNAGKKVRLVDPVTAPVVVRIFEMRAAGMSGQDCTPVKWGGHSAPGRQLGSHRHRPQSQKLRQSVDTFMHCGRSQARCRHLEQRPL